MARGQLRIVDPDGDEPAPSDQITEALAALGLQADGDLEVEEVFELWPENVKAFNYWRSVQTQWMFTGMGVATGLNYAGIESDMNMNGIRKKDRPELFAAVKVMEAAALREWAQQR